MCAMPRLHLLLALCSISLSFATHGQAVLNGQDTSYRVITTAVPFLTISPDARAAAMGDAGAATTPDANATYWNAAKLVFAPRDRGVSLSYSPWLRRLVGGMSLAYVSAYSKIDDKQAVALSMNYFNLGDLSLKDNTGLSAGDFKPREFAAAATYARKLSGVFSLAATVRYIYSDVYGTLNTNSAIASQAGQAVSGDLGAYFRTYTEQADFPVRLAFGAVLSNIGTKMNYGGGQRNYLPASLRVGSQMSFVVGAGQFNFALDLSKWLVPTPPVYETIDGQVRRNPDGNPLVRYGKDPNRSYLGAMFGSFGDAPGGFSEEMREVMVSAGGEYVFNNLLMFRLGYFYESPVKGGREYFSAGAGARLGVVGLDLAYLIPTQQNHPLGETIRFSVNLDTGEKFVDKARKVARQTRQKRSPNRKQRPPQYKNRQLRRR